MQSSAAILCRQLGFEDGIYNPLPTVPSNTTLRPPWLSSAACVGLEEEITDCDIAEFGSVSSCGRTQQVVCTAEQSPLPAFLSPCNHTHSCCDAQTVSRERKRYTVPGGHSLVSRR